MKRLFTFALTFVLTALLAVSTFGQAAPLTKIGWIDTGAFGGTDDKGTGGVTKYVVAMKTLDTEFQPRITELQNIDKRIKDIAAELQKMQQANPAVPVNQATILAKQEEGQKLARELEFKQKDAEALFQTRRNTVLGPIQNDIGKAIQEFAKTKGFAAVFDIAALANANAILALDPASDITKEFITFYNARPAAAATAATPK